MLTRLMLAATLAASLASAQRGGGGGGGGGRGGGGGGDFGTRPVQRQTRFDVFADHLKLSKEQKDEARTILSAAIEESMSIRTDLDKGRVAVAGAMIDGKGADEMKKVMDDLTLVEARMAAVEAKAFAKLYATLKPNQQSKAAQSFDLLAQTLDGPVAANRGGRGRGGQ